MLPRQAKARLIQSVVGGNCVRLTNRRQSDSEDRSKSNRLAPKNSRHPIRQAPQLFKLQSCNAGVKGAEPLAFSWGFKGAILSRERMAPFAAPLRVRREKHAALPRCITRSGTLPQPPHPRSDTAARPWRKTSHSPRRIRRSSADATLSRLRFRHSPASRSS